MGIDSHTPKIRYGAFPLTSIYAIKWTISNSPERSREIYENGNDWASQNPDKWTVERCVAIRPCGHKNLVRFCRLA